MYIEATERNMDNHVYLIERLWTAADGQQMFFGNWFCRPNETFHLASRKFLEQVSLCLNFFVGECLKKSISINRNCSRVKSDQLTLSAKFVDDAVC